MISRSVRAATLHHCCSATARLQQLLYAAPGTLACRSSHTSSQSISHHDELPYISQPVQQVDQVPVPLCRRPAQFIEQLSALIHWRQETLDRIQQLGNAFEASDGGASAAELQREVNWVLDDAVAAWRELDQQQWQTCSWQQLDMELSAAARRKKPTQGWQVQLRLPVRHLQQLWTLRLQDRVPFQYLIATAHWRDLVLAVGPGILVPRPETELMIDLTAAALAANPALAQLPWADLGTGSGALATGTAQLLTQIQRQQQGMLATQGQQQQGILAGSAGQQQQGMLATRGQQQQGMLATRGQQQQGMLSSQGQQQQGMLAGSAGHQAAEGSASGPQVYAVDLSHTAVAYATANAAAYGLQETVIAVQGSWYEPLQHLQEKLGGVVSNPPYIPRSQIEAGLQVEVGRHEPMSALDGGAGEGMDSLQVICEQAVPMLAPGGFIVLETAGADQAPLVQQLLQSLRDSKTAAEEQPGATEAAAFADVQVHNDCYGVPRFVSATRSL